MRSPKIFILMEREMIIASVVVKTIEDKAENLVLKLNDIPNVTTHGIHKNDNIIVLIEADSAEHLEGIGKFINSEFEEVMGTYPTFISTDVESEELKKEINS